MFRENSWRMNLFDKFKASANYRANDSDVNLRPFQGLFRGNLDVTAIAWLWAHQGTLDEMPRDTDDWSRTWALQARERGGLTRWGPRVFCEIPIEIAHDRFIRIRNRRIKETSSAELAPFVLPEGTNVGCYPGGMSFVSLTIGLFPHRLVGIRFRKERGDVEKKKKTFYEIKENLQIFERL